jgi:hypothetical protein
MSFQSFDQASAAAVVSWFVSASDGQGCPLSYVEVPSSELLQSAYVAAMRALAVDKKQCDSMCFHSGTSIINQHHIPYSSAAPAPAALISPSISSA